MASPSQEVLSAYDRAVSLSDPAMVILTVGVGDEQSGCLVGFHTQASIEPRRHLVYVSLVNHTHRLVTVATHLGVHFVSADDHELGQLFGEETGDEVDKFERCRWETGPFGVPMLLDIEHRFVGAVLGRVPGGDHDGFLLDPLAAWAPSDGTSSPLRLHDVADLDPGHPA